MLSMYYMLTALAGKTITPTVMRRILSKLKIEFRNEKVRQGVLVAGPPGQHPCSNPSERRPGWVRFEQLISDWRAWWACSAKIAAILSQDRAVEIGELLSELQDADLVAYSGRKNQYASVRFVRMLVQVSNCRFADTADDWGILRAMTVHVRGAVVHYGLERYEDAIQVRNAMRRAAKTKGGYSLSDLIIFLCLLRNPEEKAY